MFDVSRHDARLPNKAEVLVLLLEDAAGGAARPLAISADFLRERRVFEIGNAERRLVVITSAEGANRVYEAGENRFASIDDQGRAIDRDGRVWAVGEESLQATFDPHVQLPRVPAHRAFWFGWYAQHPETLLIR